MKKVTILETVDELLDAFNPVRERDNGVFIPLEVTLVKLADGSLAFVGDKASLFETTVSYRELEKRCLELARVRIDL